MAFGQQEDLEPVFAVSIGPCIPIGLPKRLSGARMSKVKLVMLQNLFQLIESDWMLQHHQLGLSTARLDRLGENRLLGFDLAPYEHPELMPDGPRIKLLWGCHPTNCRGNTNQKR